MDRRSGHWRPLGREPSGGAAPEGGFADVAPVPVDAAVGSRNVPPLAVRRRYGARVAAAAVAAVDGDDGGDADGNDGCSREVDVIAAAAVERIVDGYGVIEPEPLDGAAAVRVAVAAAYDGDGGDDGDARWTPGWRQRHSVAP